MKTPDMSESVEKDPIKKLRKIFEVFSVQAQDSSIYEFLSLKIASDLDLLKAIPTEGTQPIPNLFLAAINYLLYQNSEDELAGYYPNHSGKINLTDTFYQEFKKFYYNHEVEIHHIMGHRLVQTNEVRRCSALMAAAGFAYQQTGRPLALIDVGSSSGLNLLMDRYKVQFSNGETIGNGASSLTLQTRVEGMPAFRLMTPQISFRYGIDLNPIDLNDEDEMMWALSLIWPDQLERLQRLQTAALILRQNPVTLKRGNALNLSSRIAHEIPESSCLCFMHSFVLNQFAPEDRIKFEEVLKNISKRREAFRISFEWIDTEKPEIVLEHFFAGQKKSRQVLAQAHHHGEWIKWLQPLAT